MKISKESLEDSFIWSYCIMYCIFDSMRRDFFSTGVNVTFHRIRLLGNWFKIIFIENFVWITLGIIKLATRINTLDELTRISRIVLPFCTCYSGVKLIRKIRGPLFSLWYHSKQCCYEVVRLRTGNSALRAHFWYLADCQLQVVWHGNDVNNAMCIIN